mgnify:CR=1 FL=1
MEELKNDLENNLKDNFEERLAKLKNLQEAIALEEDVKKAIEAKQIDENYIKYIRNSIENQFFCDAKFDKVSTKFLIEEICPIIVNSLNNAEENVDIQQLVIDDVGEHFEGQDHYLDKICIYKNHLVCLFGVKDTNRDETIIYERRKFSREDRIEAVKAKYEEGKEVELEQYDEYYLGIEPDRIKVFSERKMVALAPIEETPFDKIKNKLTKIFSNSLFSHKKRILPHLDLVYDTNPNRWKNFENHSKTDAKLRMKFLLAREREQTRNVNE